MPVSASYRWNLAPCSDSNKVKGGGPLWGQFFICKIKNGGLDNEMGMSIGAKRKCPCPLWGQFFICKIKNWGLDNAEPAEQVSASYRGSWAPRNDSN